MCSNICSLLCALVVVCRTKYKMLNRLRSNLPGIPFVALTATATERSKNHFFLSHLGYWHCVLIRVRGDIHESLVLHNPFIYIGSFDRPNLFYGVKLIKSRSSKLQTILEMLRDVPRRVESRESTIIYCVTIKDTQQEMFAVEGTWPQTILEMLRDVPRRVESRESTIIYCVTIKDTQQEMFAVEGTWPRTTFVAYVGMWTHGGTLLLGCNMPRCIYLGLRTWGYQGYARS
jgi:hypothetical protein